MELNGRKSVALFVSMTNPLGHLTLPHNLESLALLFYFETPYIIHSASQPEPENLDIWHFWKIQNRTILFMCSGPPPQFQQRNQLAYWQI